MTVALSRDAAEDAVRRVEEALRAGNKPPDMSGPGKSAVRAAGEGAVADGALGSPTSFNARLIAAKNRYGLEPDWSLYRPKQYLHRPAGAPVIPYQDHVQEDEPEGEPVTVCVIGDAHDWVLQPVATASHVWPADTVEALYDGVGPSDSGDQSVPRFTWWDHTGGTEWVQYEWPEPVTASATEVYWFDDTGQGQCRVPVSWRLLYRDGDAWTPVANPSAYGTARDTYNRTTFAEVRSSAFRLEVRLGDGVSGGILEWRISPGPA